MNGLEIYEKELANLLSAAELREFTEDAIEDAFHADTGPVAGIAHLQTTKQPSSRTEDRSDDLKALLLGYLHGEASRSGTQAPFQFFRFVRNSDLKRRMAPYGLDGLV
jgi:hypothetical protein